MKSSKWHALIHIVEYIRYIGGLNFVSGAVFEKYHNVFKNIYKITSRRKQSAMRELLKKYSKRYWCWPRINNDAMFTKIWQERSPLNMIGGTWSKAGNEQLCLSYLRKRKSCLQSREVEGWRNRWHISEFLNTKFGIERHRFLRGRIYQEFWSFTSKTQRSTPRTVYFFTAWFVLCFAKGSYYFFIFLVRSSQK